MADIFGKTEVLPSWLRDDGERAVQGFQMGAQIGNAYARNKQNAIENQRAERRMTIEEDQAETRKMLAQSQMEGQRLKVDEEKAFAADTPAILQFGQAALKASTVDEIDQLAAGIKLQSYAGQQALEKVKSVHEGRVAKKRLESFGTQFDSAVQAFTMANGRPPTDDERRVISSETFMRVDPEQWSKSVLPRQIAADAIMEAAQLRTDASMANQASRALSAGFGGAAGVRAKEGVTKQVEALKGIGYNPSPEQVAAAEAASISGGMTAANAPAALIKDVETENTSFLQLERAVDSIDKFNEKFGPNAFEEYVGPIDAPVFRAKAGAIDPKKLKEADAEARKIFRTVNFIVQGYRKGNFGTALTANETQAFNEIIAPNSQADYVEGLRTFKENVKQKVGQSVSDHALSPNIPFPIKERFLKGSQPVAVEKSTEVQIPVGNGQKLDIDSAKIFLNKAGGDKSKARQMAVQAGFIL